MDTQVKLALIAVIAPTLAVLGAIIVALISHGRKLDHITVLTNSTLTAANERIEALEEVIKRLVADKVGVDKTTDPTKPPAP